MSVNLPHSEEWLRHAAQNGVLVESGHLDLKHESPLGPLGATAARVSTCDGVIIPEFVRIEPKHVTI
jgi:hypothetical protein